MNEKLTLAARCALAELVGLHLEGCLPETGERAILDLYQALKERGENMVDFEEALESSVARRIGHSQTVCAS